MQGPPAKRQRTTGASLACAQEPTKAATAVSPTVTLDCLPVEILTEIVSHLPGWALAAAACTCRTLEAIARDTRLWEAAYRRDIDPDGPPIEHRDHAVHGKDIRWLYGLMRLPPGRMRTGPTGRLTGRIVAADGIARHSGEFAVVVAEGTVDAALRLDGYGAVVAKDKDGRWCATEGACVAGKFTGRATRHWRAASVNARGSPEAFEHVYRGEMVESDYRGVGVITFADGTTHGAVFDGPMFDGRCVSTAVVPGSVYAGQCADRKPTGYGVVRLPDGRTREYWGDRCPEDRDTQWCIERHATSHKGGTVTRLAYEMSPGMRMSLGVRHGARDRTDQATPPDDDSLLLISLIGARAYHAGHVMVWDGAALLFLAVSHGHADRRLAGMRFFDNDPRARLLLGLGVGEAPSFDALVAFDAIDADTVTKALAQVDGACNATTANAGARDDDGSAMDLDLIGNDHGDNPPSFDEPFGIATAGRDGKWWVRCFLTGRRVEATRCAFCTSGRLYEAEALARWDAYAILASDPETGDSVRGCAFRVLWKAWMASVPADVLAYAAADTISSTGLGKVPLGSPQGERAASDIVRLRLVRVMSGALQGLPPRDVGLLTTTDPAEGDADALVRGFDFISLRHVELRHPDWDARGPWSGSAPRVPFDDPTLGDHERSVLVGSEGTRIARLDAHLDSHGVLRVDLTAASFVGAHLVGVFFFGQHFIEASFAGAVLDRCAFVGCTFERCVMTRAIVLYCGFWDCRRVREADAKPLSADKVDKIIKKGGGLL